MILRIYVITLYGYALVMELKEKTSVRKTQPTANIGYDLYPGALAGRHSVSSLMMRIVTGCAALTPERVETIMTSAL